MEETSGKSKLGLKTEPLFSRRFGRPDNTFFIDVYTASNGAPFITIVESKKVSDVERKRESVLLFPEDLISFMGALKEATKVIMELQGII